MTDPLGDLSLSASAITVRRIREADHAAVAALTLDAYQPFLEGPDDPYRESLADIATRDREAEVWIAELDGVVVGTVTMCPPGSPWREAGRDDEGEFRMLAVSPAAHRRGVGRALAQAVIDRFDADGLAGVVLSSLPVQRDAHRVYARLGFERAPERDHEPHPGVRLLVLQRRLR